MLRGFRRHVEEVLDVEFAGMVSAVWKMPRVSTTSRSTEDVLENAVSG